MEKITAARFSDILNRDRNFSDLDFTGKNLEMLLGARPALVEAWFNRIGGTRLLMSNFNVSNSEFVDSNLSHASFSGCAVTLTDFRNSQMLEAIITSASFVRCDFRNADLRHASFQSSSLEQCDFRGASMNGAFFRGAALVDCKFDPCWRLQDNLMVRAPKAEN